MARLNPYASADYPAPTRFPSAPLARPDLATEGPDGAQAARPRPGFVAVSGRRSPRPAPTDPLRLCGYATIAVLGWAFGPFALIFFAGLGLLSYARARLAGRIRTGGLLRDSRIVVGYLGLLAVAGLAGAVLPGLNRVP